MSGTIEAIKKSWAGLKHLVDGRESSKPPTPNTGSTPMLILRTEFAADRQRNFPQLTHWHTCRVKRFMLGSVYEPHMFVCMGTTDPACEQARVIAEIGCMMEEEVRRLGGNPSAVAERWMEEVNVKR